MKINGATIAVVLLIVVMGIALTWAIPLALDTKEVSTKMDSLTIKYSAMKYYTDSITAIHNVREEKMKQIAKDDSIKSIFYDDQIKIAKSLLPADKQRVLADRIYWFKKRYGLH